MELVLYLKIIKKNYLKILFSSILGLCVFYIFYLVLPQSYLSEGTIYAYPVNKENQKSEISNELNYARNIIALSNSPEFKNLLNQKNLSKVSFTPLVGIVGNLKLKEISPNILSLSLVASNEEESRAKFKEYFVTLNDFTKVLNQGNSNFELKLLSENPIVTRNEKNIYLFFLLGFISGGFVYSFYLYIKKND